MVLSHTVHSPPFSCSLKQLQSGKHKVVELQPRQKILISRSKLRNMLVRCQVMMTPFVESTSLLLAISMAKRLLQLGQTTPEIISGRKKQRISIAPALATCPVCSNSDPLGLDFTRSLLIQWKELCGAAKKDIAAKTEVPLFCRRSPHIHNALFECGEDNGPDSPLLKRAWAYQERLLAPRVLHFTTEELMFDVDISAITELLSKHCIEKCLTVRATHFTRGGAE